MKKARERTHENNCHCTNFHAKTTKAFHLYRHTYMDEQISKEKVQRHEKQQNIGKTWTAKNYPQWHANTKTEIKPNCFKISVLDVIRSKEEASQVLIYNKVKMNQPKSFF